MKRTVYKYFGMLFGAVAMLSGCDVIYDELDACTQTYDVKFKFDYNILEADAFHSQVRSVNVWAFDESGRLAWKGSESGEALKSPEFSIPVDVAPGRKYSFIAWCGLQDPVKVASSDPASPTDLGVSLMLDKDSGGNLYSGKEIAGLYHGMALDVFLEKKQNDHVHQTVEIPLMKDSKTVRFMLQHLDGSPIDRNDFEVTVTDNNSNLNWDNSIADGPWFDYRPWRIDYGQVTSPERRTVTSVATLLYELSLSRLRAGHDVYLTVHRNTDNRDIIRIPLVKYLLMVKGHYNEKYSDQEYLDRMDEFNLLFFIDSNNNWYTASGIYINDWVVVPPQNEDI